MINVLQKSLNPYIKWGLDCWSRPLGTEEAAPSNAFRCNFTELPLNFNVFRHISSRSRVYPRQSVRKCVALWFFVDVLSRPEKANSVGLLTHSESREVNRQRSRSRSALISTFVPNDVRSRINRFFAGDMVWFTNKDVDEHLITVWHDCKQRSVRAHPCKADLMTTII